MASENRRNYDWQSSMKTVLQRNNYMFDNELISDVSFVCDCRESNNHVFYAHKYVLATSSAVFFDLFYGDSAQKLESPICIKNADEDSFKEFQRFLYVDNCDITAENAIGIIYLAKKYLILPLLKKCCEFLEVNIDPDNAFTVLEEAIKFEEKKLEAKCWDFISKNTSECLESDAFCDISSQTLVALLRRGTLHVTEVELFKQVVTWVEVECTRRNIDTDEDKTARRRVLGNTVYEIRFLAFSREEIVKHVSPTGVLTDKELDGITQKLSGIDVPGLKWQSRKKRPVPVLSFIRFDPAKITKCLRWHCNGLHLDALNLTVNEAVFFHGVRLFAGPSGSEYEVKFTIKDESLTSTYCSEEDSDGVWGFDVILPRPISLPRDEEVAMTASLSGPPVILGDNGKSSVKVDDIVITFKNSRYGQFYKIYVSSEL